MTKPILERILRPFGDIRSNEVGTVLLMFCYSFLAMMAYNILQPIQRSLFIDALGANKIPYVQLAAGAMIGLIMTGYAWLMGRLPRRWSLPIIQAAIAVVLVIFWFLFQTDLKSVYVAFYILGLILGILLISQFWTLANVVYDPRQAKRLFGFIGGGSSLGGMFGALVTWFSRRIGTVNLLLISASLMLICMAIVILIIRKERVGEEAAVAAVQEEKGVGARRAFQLLKESKHLRLIALVISFGAIGAAIVDQQLNMATQSFKGQAGRDAMTAFLGQVRVWTSAIGFIIQVALTSRIHRTLGIGFALLLLPLGLGATGTVILLNAVLWAPSLARVLDQSLRYTVDKTTREILYMPLPHEIKYEAKPFVDVTLDRFAKGLTAVLLLVLISPWGLELGWQKLSYVSVGLTCVWILAALQAKRGYQAAFRQSIENREMNPAEVRLAVADLSTIETLIEELASPDERRVLYAIDMLESLEKRRLVTPLLLYHESPAVRIRALALIGRSPDGNPQRWLPTFQRMLGDPNPGVRAAAVGALCGILNQDAAELVRPMMWDPDPRIVLTAAMVLSRSTNPEDAAIGEKSLSGIVYDTRDSAADLRREFAIAIRHVNDPRCRRLLIPLLQDPNFHVAEEALRSVRLLGIADFIFVPSLISLLCNRRFKSSAREQLVQCGEQVLPILEHFLRDPEEEIWVRRHIPATIARIPAQKSMDILTAALEEQDGFLRYKVIAAIEKLHRDHPEFSFHREPIERLALQEISNYSKSALLHGNLLQYSPSAKGCLLERAMREKQGRSLDRIYRILGILYPWKDIQSSRWAIERGGSRQRASAIEYLDSLLSGTLRSQLLPVLEETRSEDLLLKRSGLSKGLPKSLEELVLRLIHDADPLISASAIHFVRQAMLSSLAQPMEELLATRDAHDWYVFEAVSWVLAAFRMSETRRRALWQEPLPAIEVAERLQRLPVFASVSVYELVQIASTGRQVRHEAGRWLTQVSVVPDTLQFLLDGSVTLHPATGEGEEPLEAPAVLCFREVLEGAPARNGAQTVGPGICLSLGSEEWRTLLADNTDLVQGLFRVLCESGAGTRRTVLEGAPEGRRPDLPTGSLNPIDRVLLFQTVGVFSKFAADEMLNLASIAVELPLVKGAQVFNEADPPAIYAMVSAELILEGPARNAPLHAVPGDVIGVYETLAGVPLGLKATVVQEGLALRLDREELFDLLSQRPDLLQQFFEALFRCHSGPSAVGVA